MNSTTKPLVSVIMAAYKQSGYIKDALDSLLAQTYTNWEVAIVDDGSPDDIAEVIKEYTSSDSRIKFYHTENKGVSAARNFGVSKTSGSFIIPLDADDIFMPQYIECCVKRFLSHPETLLVYCEWMYFGEKTRAPKLSYSGYENLFNRNSIFASAMFRRTDFMRVGGYDEKMLIGWEDWELWVRMLDEHSIVYQIPKPLFKYRIKKVSRNVTANNLDNSNKVFTYIYYKHKDLFEKYYGSEALVMKAMLDYQYRINKWKNRSILGRLWFAIKRKI